MSSADLRCAKCGADDARQGSTYFDALLIADRVATLANLSPARVLFIMYDLPCVEWTTTSRQIRRVRIHTLDVLTKSVIDYDKLRESIKRLGGK